MWRYLYINYISRDVKNNNLCFLQNINTFTRYFIAYSYSIIGDSSEL